ncbi:hypothetical protein D3C84_765570 [compost metagenome]
MLNEVVDSHRTAKALAEQDQRLALDLGGLVEPFERRIDVLIDRRQARFAFGQAITAIVHQQHLIALFRQPPTPAQMHWQIAAVTVQVQHRAFDLDTLLHRQPPRVQLETIGGVQGDGAVFEPGLFRREQLAGFGIKQQGAATAQGQEKADDAEDSHPLKPRENGIGIRPNVGAGLLANAD